MLSSGGTTVDVPGSHPLEAGNLTAPPSVRLVDVRKTFGDVVAVERLTLMVNAGEFFTLLGPSGSGKTTTLRVIAGFEPADSGSVELHGVDVTRSPPYQRPVNTVFQDYALFPHMSVIDNVAYGLRVRGVGKRDRHAQAADALKMVRLPDIGTRRPVQLSGGQRQRVALARALVNRPRVLLLDEPLGALDLKLRQEMQLELKTIQRELSENITFLYVTHDQDEALTMSDRIAVFCDGRIEQVGTPGGRRTPGRSTAKNRRLETHETRKARRLAGMRPCRPDGRDHGLWKLLELVFEQAPHPDRERRGPAEPRRVGRLRAA